MPGSITDKKDNFDTWLTGFTLVILGGVTTLIFISNGIQGMTQFLVTDPAFWTIAVFSGILALLDEFVKESYNRIVTQNGENSMSKEFNQLFKESRSWNNIVQEMVQRKLSKRSRLVYGGPFITGYLVIIAIAWHMGLFGVFSGVVSTSLTVLAFVLVLLYWFVAFAAFLERWRAIRILILHAKETFSQPLRIHEMQKSHLDMLSKIDSSKSIHTYQLSSNDLSSAHYGFYNTVASLVSKTRSLVLLLSILGVVMMLFALNAYIVLLLALLLVVIITGIEFIRLELVVHNVLYISKRNLIRFYEGAYHLAGLDLVLNQMYKKAGDKDEKGLVYSFNRTEYYGTLLDRVMVLPTWTVESKLALPLIGSIMIQGIFLLLRYLMQL